MLTISNQDNGYKILLSNPGTGTRGYSVQARDVEEIHKAVDHYYHGKHRQDDESCPLCRTKDN